MMKKARYLVFLQTTNRPRPAKGEEGIGTGRVERRGEVELSHLSGNKTRLIPDMRSARCMVKCLYSHMFYVNANPDNGSPDISSTFG